MILADNGSPWYVTGTSDPRFDDDVLHELDLFTGATWRSWTRAGWSTARKVGSPRPEARARIGCPTDGPSGP